MTGLHVERINVIRERMEASPSLPDDLRRDMADLIAIVERQGKVIDRLNETIQSVGSNISLTVQTLSKKTGDERVDSLLENVTAVLALSVVQGGLGIISARKLMQEGQ